MMARLRIGITSLNKGRSSLEIKLVVSLKV
jgi:hypothetical protein